MSRFLLLRALCCVILLAGLVGCGGSNDGPKRYAVSGDVTFQGQPVPKGFVTLEPDADRGNSGPGGGAEIVNGRYDTKLDAGVVGGPYKVRIVGTDGVPVTESGEELTDGKPLFPPFETTFEFPTQDSVKDFAVP